MLEPVSVALQFGFLAVLYLFLLWVSRSALRDLRRTGDGRASAAGPVTTPAPDATGLHPASRGPAVDGAEPRLVVERAPGHTPGMEYDIGEGAVLGRGDQAEIRLDDPFASSAPRAAAAPGWDRRARGHGLDERHVPQRGAPQRAAAAASRRSCPDRRQRVHLP